MKRRGPIFMIEIQKREQIRSMHNKGVPIKQISRSLVISRNTVRRWIHGSEPKEPTYGVARDFLNKNAQAIRDLFLRFEGHCKPLKRYLNDSLGQNIGLRTLQRFCQEFRAEITENKANSRFETAPGHQLQVDFGERYVAVGGEIKKVHFLVAILGYSRRIFVKAYSSENTAAWLNGIESAMRFFGGIPSEIVTDNTRCLIREHRNRTRAIATERYDQFCRYWNIIPVACTPYYPQSKGKVERAVRYVKENALCGKEFKDFCSLNLWLTTWCEQESDHRQLSEHGYKTPKERFYIEKNCLRAIEQIPIANVIEETRHVSSTGLIRIDGEFYRLPNTLVNKEVQVLYDEISITVSRKGQLVIELDKRSSVYKPKQQASQIDPGTYYEAYQKNPLQRDISVYELVLGGSWK